MTHFCQITEAQLKLWEEYENWELLASYAKFCDTLRSILWPVPEEPAKGTQKKSEVLQQTRKE